MMCVVVFTTVVLDVMCVVVFTTVSSVGCDVCSCVHDSK